MFEDEKDPAGQDPADNEDDKDQDPTGADPAEDEEEDTDPEDEDDIEALKTKAKTLSHQKALYRDKYKKAQQEVEDLKKKTNPPESKTPQKKQDAFKIESGERAEFRQDHPDLTREDVNEIQAFAESHKIPLEEAVKKPMVQAFLDKQREKRDLDDGTPSSSRSGTSKRETNVDWMNMDEASFKKKRQNILAQRQNTSR
jgi:hypothetical protein